MAYKPYTIPKAPALASVAASGAGSDPFGLASGTAGLFGTASGPAKAPTVTPYSSAGSQYRAGVGTGGATNTVKPPAAAVITTEKQQTPTAPTISYDINTDPAYQAAVSLVGQSDQQARAAAQKQIRDMLLAYGDAGLAGQSALGGDSTLAKAAAQNPTSTVAQLNDQYRQGLTALEQGLRGENLTFSGYRVKQEKQAAKNLQNALAQAAAGLNTNIDSVNQNLAAALAANQQQQIGAANSAADRQWQLALQGLLAGAPTGGGDNSTPPPDTSSAATPNAGTQGYSPATLATIAAGLQRRQGFLNYGLRNSGMA